MLVNWVKNNQGEVAALNLLGPVAALAADVEHEAGSTVLDVGFSLVALKEVVPVGRVGVDSVSLSSAESRTITATFAAATIGEGHVGVDWRQGIRTSTAS